MNARDRAMRAAIMPLRWWPRTRPADDKAMLAAQAAGLVEGEHVSRALQSDPTGPLMEWSMTAAGFALVNGETIASEQAA